MSILSRPSYFSSVKVANFNIDSFLSIKEAEFQVEVAAEREENESRFFDIDNPVYGIPRPRLYKVTMIAYVTDDQISISP